MAASQRSGALPMHANGPRHHLPRKVVLQRQRLVGIAFVILGFIFLLMRYAHRVRPPQHVPPNESKKQWSAISPRYPLSEMATTPRNIYYLTKEDVLYCYIPKNACSRFKPLMRKREGFSDWQDRSKIHGKNGLQRLNWLSHSQALDRLRDPTMKKFVVVRDPFSRLVSAYQNKVATPWPDQREDFWKKHLRKECPALIDSREMPKEGPLLSLEDFLKCLMSPDNIEPSNEHWRPQTQLCGLDYIKYDSYLHLETLVDDVSDLLGKLNWNENTTDFEMHRAPVYSKNLEEYFSDEAIKMTLDYYADDFDLLHYPPFPSGRIDFYSVFDGTNYLPGFVPPINGEVQNESVTIDKHEIERIPEGENDDDIHPKTVKMDDENVDRAEVHQDSGTHDLQHENVEQPMTEHAQVA